MYNITNIIKSGVPLLLEGPTGVGKTYKIQELATKANKTLYVIDVSGELTVDSILGRETLVDGSIQWRDGTLTNALRKGAWVMCNELNTALPEVLTVINGVLDDQRAVTLPNCDNERVVAHPDFRFIATQNPANGNYAGTARLNDALLNRMVKVVLDYLPYSEEMAVLAKHTTLADSTRLQLVKLAEYTRRNMDDPLSTRDLVKILRLREAGGLSLKDAVATVCLSRYTHEEYKKLYEYHSNVMDDINALVSKPDVDPFEDIKAQYKTLREEQAKLDAQKANLRKAVKAELLKELIDDSVGEK
jgi:uncharacterized protein with ATP-grasp and redox domains